jgi:hypothetical protein
MAFGIGLFSIKVVENDHSIPVRHVGPWSLRRKADLAREKDSGRSTGRRRRCCVGDAEIKPPRSPLVL